MLKTFFTAVTRNFVSLIGVVVTTISAFLFLTMFAIESFAHVGGAYTGIFSFVVLPGVFALGLVLIPIGIWRFRRLERKRAAAGQAATLAPVIDLNVPRTRNIALVFGGLTLANFVILATGTYKAIEVMETTEFCGGACHSVMSPEFTTYQRSNHARVRCTQCHIGPGADWFVKSKLSGSWQLIAVALDLYPRPIGTPIPHLRPARETCEQCHWPTKFVGERLKVITHFDEDEKQTEKKTVLLLKVGGVLAGKGKGIHWHVDPKNQIRYRSDDKRQTIYEVELTQAEGPAKHFKNTEVTGPDAGVTAEWRTMDCVDCHNRPSHVYQRPRDEVEDALIHGELDRELPYIRREALRIVQLPFASHDEAKTGIKNALFEFYGKDYPDLAKNEAKKIADAAEVLHRIYARNVFPEMKITWGTYPNFRYDEGGCFRCHQSELVADDGKKISKKCDLCHEVLAESEAEPEILELLAPP